MDYHEAMIALQKQTEALLQAIKDSGITVDLHASDIRIGAVELQDKEDEKRVDVEDVNTGITPGNCSLLVKAQICDSNGNIIDPSSSEGYSPPTSIVAGSVILPNALPSMELKRGVIIKASSSNSDSITLNSGLTLEPGESCVIEIDDISKITLSGTAGDIIEYLGS